MHCNDAVDLLGEIYGTDLERTTTTKGFIDDDDDGIENGNAIHSCIGVVYPLSISGHLYNIRD